MATGTGTGTIRVVRPSNTAKKLSAAAPVRMDNRLADAVEDNDIVRPLSSPLPSIGEPGSSLSTLTPAPVLDVLSASVASAQVISSTHSSDEEETEVTRMLLDE